MQKDQPETPKLRRIRKPHVSTTPDLTEQHSTIATSRVGRKHHRSTMAPADFLLSENFSARRQIGMSHRMSMVPLQQSQEGPKASDIESDEAELSRLYDEYLQTTMTMLIIKKKTEERKNFFLNLLATITREREHDEEKLFNLKTMERDLIYLTKAQNEVDMQIIDVKNCTETDALQSLKDMLSQLYYLLQPLDVLHCNNIILPETAEEWKDTEVALKDCAKTLRCIMELIGSKGDSYKSVYAGIKDFMKTYNEIEDHKEKLKKALCSLQVLILKTASLCLTSNDESLES